MPPACQESKEGPVKLVAEPCYQNMGVQMIDAQKRLVQPQGKSLGKGHANKKAAQEARPPGSANIINFLAIHPRLLDQFIKKGADITVMLPRGQLRHHSAKKTVDIRLACQNGMNKPAVFNQGKTCFITGSFNT